MVALLVATQGIARPQAANASITVSMFAGTGTAGYNGDGVATSTELSTPQGVATDGVGNVYIFDDGNRRFREVDTSGNLHTIAGTGSPCSATTPTALTNSFGPDNPGVCHGPNGSGVTLTGNGFAVGEDGTLLFGNNGWLDEVSANTNMYHIAGNVTDSTYTPGTGSAFSVSVIPYSLATSQDERTYFAEDATSGYPGYTIYSLAGGTIAALAGMNGGATCNYHPYNGETALGACIHPDDLALWSHYLYFFDASPGWQGPEIYRIDLSQSSPTRVRDGHTRSSLGPGSVEPTRAR